MKGFYFIFFLFLSIEFSYADSHQDMMNEAVNVVKGKTGGAVSKNPS